MSYVIFVSQSDAEYHARALGFADEYMADKGDGFGTRPALPRCDGPRWGDPRIVQGAGNHPTCACVTRGDPGDDCVYATRSHADVLLLPDGSFAVGADAVALTQNGKRVRVGSTDVDVVTSGARGLTVAEEAFTEGAEAVWSEDSRVVRGTL